MRLHRLTFVLALLLGLAWTLPAYAGSSITVKKLPACKNARDGDWYAVKDGANTSDCTTGLGDTRVMCGCNNGVWSAFLAVPTSISFAGQVAITATGAGNDITHTSPDDFIATITDDTTWSGDVMTFSPTSFILDPGGSTDELTVTAGTTVVAGTFRITAQSAPPVACAAGTKGTIYIDSDVNFPCHCDGTSYKKLTDNTTTTGCS